MQYLIINPIDREAVVQHFQLTEKQLSDDSLIIIMVNHEERLDFDWVDGEEYLEIRHVFS